MCRPICFSGVTNELCDFQVAAAATPLHSGSTVAFFISKRTDPLLPCRRLTGAELRPRHLAPQTQGSTCGRGMLEYDCTRGYLGCHTFILLLQTLKLAVMGHLESCLEENSYCWLPVNQREQFAKYLSMSGGLGGVATEGPHLPNCLSIPMENSL